VIPLLLLQSALAAPPPAPIAPEFTEDPQQLIVNLSGDSAKDRVFAARELRRQARRAVGDLDSRDDLRAAEARLLLEALDSQAAPACIAALGSHIAGLCADVLAILETTGSLPALHAAAPATAGVSRRKVERAITFLESL
jgi:hypothetical protein